MGLLAGAKAEQTRVRGALFVDRGGIRRSRATESAPTGGLMGDSDIVIVRGGLIDLLEGATQDAAQISIR